jgi:hypothetical protein
VIGYCLISHSPISYSHCPFFWFFSCPQNYASIVPVLNMGMKLKSIYQCLNCFRLIIRPTYLSSACLPVLLSATTIVPHSKTAHGSASSVSLTTVCIRFHLGVYTHLPPTSDNKLQLLLRQNIRILTFVLSSF